MADVKLYLGDCLDIMRGMDAESVDSIVTDPPYGLSFMGKNWDHGVPGVAYWKEALRVAKPGAYLLAFGGTRTFHRLTCAIEDAGWEIRDTIMWVYGSGFPKSHNVGKAIQKMQGIQPESIVKAEGVGMMNKANGKGGRAYKRNDGGWNETKNRFIMPEPEGAAKQWDGWGTALKPAWEPVIVARKPISGTVAENVLQYGTGAMNIDGCRVTIDPDDPNHRPGESEIVGPSNSIFGTSKWRRGNMGTGRWPANVIHDGSDEVLALFPQTHGANNKKATPCTITKEQVYAGGWQTQTKNPDYYGDNGGSAARFFYCAPFDDIDLLFCRAKTIMQAWRIPCLNLENANTAEMNLFLSSQAVGSVLSDAVTAASLGDRLVRNIARLSTNVTAIECEKLLTTLIATILSLGNEALRVTLQEKPTPNGCHVKIAEAQSQKGITTITISLWKSGGSADAVTLDIMSASMAHGEKDSSRFYYCPKASKADRDEGCEGLDEKRPHPSGNEWGTTSMWNGENGDEEWRKKNPNLPRRNHHPTVKPEPLMRYLCKLVTPSGGVVFDPFMGSGSTGKAAVKEGFAFIGCDNEPEYIQIAECRIPTEVTIQTEMGF